MLAAEAERAAKKIRGGRKELGWSWY
jgi:hypothetical protein